MKKAGNQHGKQQIGWLRLNYCVLLGLLMLAYQQNRAQSLSSKATFKQAASFPFGTSISPKLLATSAAYRQTVEREYSSITPENHLKMHHVHPMADRYDWSSGDMLVDFAEKNGQRFHGHTLVWHQAVPDWVKNFQGDSTAWENLFKTHIQTVLTHYKGRIRSWDVVNEAVTDSGTVRKSVWSEHLGPDYVARAFRYAREVDPDVLLFYNDYGQEYSFAKLKAILNMISDFKRREVPIDGVGLQMHTHIGRPDSSIANALRQTAATGLLVHISELDVRVNQAAKPNFTPTDNLWQAQKQKFASIVRLYRTEVPKSQQYGITTWNVSDKDSWIRSFCKCSDYPLPFDAKFQKKPAYQGIMDGLK